MTVTDEIAAAGRRAPAGHRELGRPRAERAGNPVALERGPGPTESPTAIAGRPAELLDVRALEEPGRERLDIGAQLVLRDGPDLGIESVGALDALTGGSYPPGRPAALDQTLGGGLVLRAGSPISIGLLTGSWLHSNQPPS